MLNRELFQVFRQRAATGGSAAWIGRGALAAALGVGLACASLLGPAAPAIYRADPPSPNERYCAWFGDRRDDVLYFGESAFWWASRETGHPLGDLAQPGPVVIGRFDLARERLLPPLEVGKAGDRAGVWDVLAHPNGRVYFTRYFEPAGFVEPDTGRVELWPELGQGLNELALGPGGRLYVTRYPAPDGSPGALVVLDEEGGRLAEHRLPAPPGYVAGPKSVAVDPRRGEVWLTMDLLPADRSSPAPIRHDAYVLDARGALLHQIERPHLHFAAFAADGTAYLAEVEAGELALRVVSPGDDPLHADAGERVVLDAAFPEELDFAQELRVLPDGGALVTRWSGLVHRMDARGRVVTLALPPGEGTTLYYSAFLRGDRVCATRCADVSVVCSDLPQADRRRPPVPGR